MFKHVHDEERKIWKNTQMALDEKYGIWNDKCVKQNSTVDRAEEMTI